MTVYAKPAYKYYNTLASTSTGKPLSGYFVKFFYYPSDAVSPKYTDDTATVEELTATTTDSNGLFSTFLKPNYYNIRFYRSASDYAEDTNPLITLTEVPHDGFTVSTAANTEYDPYATIASTNVQDAIDESFDDIGVVTGGLDARITALEISGVPVASKAEYTYTATSNQTAFSVPPYSVLASSVDVFINGVKQAGTNFVKTSTTLVTLTHGAPLGSEVIIVIGDVVGLSGLPVYLTLDYTHQTVTLSETVLNYTVIRLEDDVHTFTATVSAPGGYTIADGTSTTYELTVGGESVSLHLSGTNWYVL